MLYARFQLACRTAAVAVLSFGLSGCFDIDQRLAFQPTGSATVEVSLRFDQDMEDIAALLQAYAQYSPDADKFKDGICTAAQRFVEAAPAAPGKKLQAQQFRIDDRFVCQFRVSVADAADLEVMDPNLPFEIKALGQRRYRIAADLSRIPDFSKELQTEFTTALRQEFPLQVPEDALAGLWGLHVTAAVALTRIMLPKRYYQLTIAAPRIVESNGTLAADGGSVSFRLSFGEIVMLALDANARKDKRFYAVIEY